MKTKITKVLMGFAALVLMLAGFEIKTWAASGNISISSANGSVGDTVSVTVSVSADEAALGEVNVSFDTNYLEYMGSSNSGDTNNGVAGLVKIVMTDIQPGAGYAVNLNFRLLAVGTTGVSVSRASLYSQVGSMEPMPYNQSNGSITIGATTAASSDNHLSGLLVSGVTANGDSSNVTYTPNFSPDVYEYTAELGPNVTRLVIATTLSDAKAKTAVSGTKIDPGNNKTTIIVTAEDGSQRVYTLYSSRAIDTTTQQPTDTLGEGQTTEETESVAEFDRTPKKIEAMNKYIIQDFSLTTIPEGFEEGTTTYNGETVAALKGIAKPLTVLCLADDAQGTNIGKYIYNELSGELNKMVDITSMQKMYTIIPTDDSYVGPEGYTQTALDVNGDLVKAWIKAEGTEFYVIYAMNWNGETSLYVYDTREQTMQRFVEGNKSEVLTDEPEEEDENYLLLKRQYNEIKDKYDNDISKKDKIITSLGIVMAIVIILALIIILGLNNSKKRLGETMYEENDEEDDMEEIGEEAILEEETNSSKEEEMQRFNKTAETQDIEAAENITELENTAAKTDNIVSGFTPEEIEPITVTPKQIDPKIVISDKEEKVETSQTEELKAEEVKEDMSDKLINMEDDEPFEIEFFDLDDNK